MPLSGEDISLLTSRDWIYKEFSKTVDIFSSVYLTFGPQWCFKCLLYKAYFTYPGFMCFNTLVRLWLSKYPASNPNMQTVNHTSRKTDRWIAIGCFIIKVLIMLNSNNLDNCTIHTSATQQCLQFDEGLTNKS